MNGHVVQLPDFDASLLIRELNQRIGNELTCAICVVSAKAMETESVVVKAALLEVVDRLSQCADVHRALHVPNQECLTDAASYLERLSISIAKYRLERLAIRLSFSADDLWLEGDRCWKLGLIVSELLTNVAATCTVRRKTRVAPGVVACRQLRKVQSF
jgi:two-component sensor histidine kinase